MVYKDKQQEKAYKKNGTRAKIPCLDENCSHEFIKRSVLDDHIRLNHPHLIGELNEMQES